MTSVFYVSTEGEGKVVKNTLTLSLDQFQKLEEIFITSILSGISPNPSVWTVGSFEHRVEDNGEILVWMKEINSLENARSALTAYKKSLIPVYKDVKIEINGLITHHFFDSRASATNGFTAEINRAVDMAAWLFEQSQRADLSNPTNLARNFPSQYLDWQWNITQEMWILLNDALKKDRTVYDADRGGVPYFRSQLSAMSTVLREIQPFGRDSGDTTNESRISLLRAPSLQNSILMGITVWLQNNKTTIAQQRITQFPTFWLYRVMHPGCCLAFERISLLMHSVTSYAAYDEWKATATKIRVPQPMPKMKELFLAGAKEHRFDVTQEGSDIVLPMNDDNYMLLWRHKWAGHLKQSICAVCWSIDPNWQCGNGSRCPKRKEGHYYCSTECGKHDWHRHVNTDGCGRLN